MNVLQEGWFSESDHLWPGQKLSFEVTDVLYEGRSAFQDVLVFHNKRYGNVLVLDGVIQCAEKDEFTYHEMMTHVPLFCHPNPAEVLIVGGGDGAILREAVKHSAVKRVTLCEIDGTVIDVCKKHLPSMMTGFDSDKLTLHIGDGFEFLKKHTGKFDVVITDVSDEAGPAESVFNTTYFQMVKNALNSNGIHVTQEDGPWLKGSKCFYELDFAKTVFPNSSYYYASVPSFPSGEIGFAISACSSDIRFEEPLRKITNEEINAMGLKYYNTDVHRASFVLPEFTRKILAAP
ncbi:spermidine synthase-like [Oscarella lobularis]|uniref:spermidine synthase-like n=1 Tax=Oscarella lobularis TaxID=121494 RepID=UPI0033140C6C